MERLNQWLTLAANLGVLFGIFFLILELQQNTTVMEATAFQDRSNDLMELNSMAIESPELLSALSQLDFPKGLCFPNSPVLNELDPMELTAFKHYIAANLFRIQNLEQQVAYGLFEHYSFEPALASLALYGEFARVLDIPQAAVADGILSKYPDYGSHWQDVWCG